MALKSMEVSFPRMGIARNLSLRSMPGNRGSYPSVWAVNVRLDENLDRRQRGGSRPGLTKYSASDFGTTIADMISVNTSSTGGTEEILLVLVDSTVKTGTGGTLATLMGYLTADDGTTIITADDGETPITVSSATAPAAGFLVAGQQNVYAVITTAIVKINPKTGATNNLLASGGSIPTGCTFGAIYRDRMIISGGDNTVYASRQGDYKDWALNKDVGDGGRAVAFQLSISSDVGEKPTALMASRDSHLLISSLRSLWILRGDPVANGQLSRISENVGVVSSRAWCEVDGMIFFLSETGLHRVSSDGSSLTPMSELKIPEELRNVDTSTTTVLMGYEKDRESIHVYLKTSVGSDNHWVYEIRSEAWWSVRLQDDHSPVAVCQHEGKLLLAGNDGYVRLIGGNDDDSVDIESHVAIGPLRLGNTNEFGRMVNLHASMAAGGGTVTWRVVTGDTAEAAADNAKAAIETFQSGGDYSSYVKYTGTWTSGRAIMSYPRVRAAWIVLWLQSTDIWAYEGIMLSTMQSGRWKGN